MNNRRRELTGDKSLMVLSERVSSAWTFKKASTPGPTAIPKSLTRAASIGG